jgi:nitroreductase
MSEQNLFSVIEKRRAVRKFKPDPIPEEHVHQMIDAARLAPTAGNRQPWKFLVVRDPAKIAEIKKRCIALRFEEYSSAKEHTPDELAALQKRIDAYYDDLFSALLYVVVVTDSEAPYAHYNIHDGALAAGYLCLAARALGYGTVYTTESIYRRAVREVCRIPERYEHVCAIPVGVPYEWPTAPSKTPLDDLIVYEAFD